MSASQLGFKSESALKPVSANANTVSATIDMAGVSDHLIYADVGVSGDSLDSTNTISISITESDESNANFAAASSDDVHDAVAANGVFAVIDSTDKDAAQYVTAYKGTKRYVRVNFTFDGTHSAGTVISAGAVKTGPVVGWN